MENPIILQRRNVESLYISVLPVSAIHPFLAVTTTQRRQRGENLENLFRVYFLRLKRMLKITRAVSSEKEISLQLDGRVSGQWVGLLRETAESVLAEGVRLTVDLKNISFIDCEGIALIRNLIERGVRHTNPPLFVAEQINRCKDEPA